MFNFVFIFLRFPPCAVSVSTESEVALWPRSAFVQHLDFDFERKVAFILPFFGGRSDDNTIILRFTISLFPTSIHSGNHSRNIALDWINSLFRKNCHQDIISFWETDYKLNKYGFYFYTSPVFVCVSMSNTVQIKFDQRELWRIYSILIPMLPVLIISFNNAFYDFDEWASLLTDSLIV